jgi:tRNA pseudouridine38-40 synthase
MAEQLSDHRIHESEAVYRIALGLEYDGSAYNGWQVQPHAPSIQGALAAAASAVANEPVTIFGAGRTDTGVHATMQVAHFDTRAERDTESWRRGINSHLPDDINVHWVRPVPETFSARFSALSRAYRYLIVNRATGVALDRQRAWWVRAPLDVSRMQQAAAHLLGEHDFNAFRAVSCQAPSSVRSLTDIRLTRYGACIAFDVRGNAFLHHMIRNIMGTLVKVGKGEAEPGWVAELLKLRDRRLSGMTAPAHGLYFVDVVYPEDYALPTSAAPVLPTTGELYF